MPNSQGRASVNGGVVAAALGERDGERLGGELIGEIGADPPAQVAVDGRVMTLEHDGERAPATRATR